MSNFKIGDRVRIYGNSQTGLDIKPRVGEVTQIIGYWINVQISPDDIFGIYTFHEKQLRKLVKKKLKFRDIEHLFGSSTFVFWKGDFIQVTSDNWQVWTGKKFRKMTDEERAEASG